MLKEPVMHLLDIDQLRTFVAIADTGSFTRAADIVHKTQSAVSMQMKRLEERLGSTIFERDGRLSKLTDEGERLLDYARRIVRLNTECIASFNDNELVGRVRLGLPDDYADRYLPEILARFSRSNPKAEVTVDVRALAEPDRPGPERRSRPCDHHPCGSARAFRDRAGRAVAVGHLRPPCGARGEPLPLALGRPTCDWRHSATEALESAGSAFRILYVSWHSTAVGAAVMAGLAVSVLPESAVRSGMRILGPSDGFPALPSCKIGLIRNRREQNPLADALGFHIKQSLDNLGAARPLLAPAAESGQLSIRSCDARPRPSGRETFLPTKQLLFVPISMRP